MADLRVRFKNGFIKTYVMKTTKQILQVISFFKSKNLVITRTGFYVDLDKLK